MDWKEIYTPKTLAQKADRLFADQRKEKRLTGWFRVQEIRMLHHPEARALPPAVRAAALLRAVVGELPLTLEKNAVFAGTQNDAFSPSYALINPNFLVETFLN
jgi:formate C-acetyltransferase